MKRGSRKKWRSWIRYQGRTGTEKGYEEIEVGCESLEVYVLPVGAEVPAGACGGGNGCIGCCGMYMYGFGGCWGFSGINFPVEKMNVEWEDWDRQDGLYGHLLLQISAKECYLVNLIYIFLFFFFKQMSVNYGYWILVTLRVLASR